MSPIPGSSAAPTRTRRGAPPTRINDVGASAYRPRPNNEEALLVDSRTPEVPVKEAIARGVKLTRVQAAEYLQVPKRTLDDWAYHGEGPRFARMVGGQTRYDIRDIDAWLEATSASTAGPLG